MNEESVRGGAVELFEVMDRLLEKGIVIDRENGGHLRIVEVDAGAPAGDAFADFPAAWDRFVEGAGDSTICHLWGWREIFSEVLGHTPRYLAALNGTGEIEGVLPLVEVRSRWTGHHLVSLPFLNDGGALGAARARVLLVEAARREAERRRVDLLEIRNRVATPSSLEVNPRRLTVLLDLPSDPWVLWEQGLTAKVRSQIRRPLKEGMRIEFGPELLSDFHQVFSRTMRDLGTPVLAVEFFESIRDRFGDRIEFAVVYQDRTPVAAGCGMRWRSEFEITWAGFLREFGSAAPNMLLYWGLIERVIEQGGTVFNFGRCAQGSGTHRFKRQWGGEDHPLPWLQWSRSGATATSDRERPLLRMASSMWRGLPLPIANAVGPYLARRLP